MKLDKWHETGGEKKGNVSNERASSELHELRVNTASRLQNP